MDFMDVHCHLNDEQFNVDRAQVISNAEDADLIGIIDSGEGFEENLKSLEISRKHGVVKSSFGFHPAELSVEKAMNTIEQIRENKKEIVAIGEVGLDYWHVKTDAEREKQRDIFSKFIKLASELDKPLVIHSRSAGKYALEMLDENNAEKVCMHAFDGSAKNAQEGIDLGYYFSIPPSVVRSRQKQKLVERVPLENLLLESDSPVLGPSPRGRNEPKNVKTSAEKIQEIKEIGVEEVAKVTTRNAANLFSI